MESQIARTEGTKRQVLYFLEPFIWIFWGKLYYLEPFIWTIWGTLNLLELPRALSDLKAAL